MVRNTPDTGVTAQKDSGRNPVGGFKGAIIAFTTLTLTTVGPIAATAHAHLDSGAGGDVSPTSIVCTAYPDSGHADLLQRYAYDKDGVFLGCWMMRDMSDDSSPESTVRGGLSSFIQRLRNAK